MTDTAFVTLNAVTSTATGAACDLGKFQKDHTLIASATNSSSSNGVVHLEGSHDGNIWVDLGVITGLGSVPEILTISTHLVRYVRGHLTVLPSGSGVTVTATLASSSGNGEVDITTSVSVV